MRLSFDHKKQEANNIYSFFFKPESHLDFTAGQYIELSLPHKNPDDRGIKRWFTISSAPTEELVSITTKIIDSSSSYKQAMLKLEVNDQLSFTGPMGDFVLPKLIQTPLVFIAGGIGITPYHSIVSWLKATHEDRPIQFIYGVKSEEEIIFQDTFEKLNIHPIIVVENPSSAWGGERGRLSAELIDGLITPSPDSLTYISGPEPMVESLSKEMVKLGTKQQQLVLDFFPNYLAI